MECMVGLWSYVQFTLIHWKRTFFEILNFRVNFSDHESRSTTFEDVHKSCLKPVFLPELRNSKYECTSGTYLIASKAIFIIPAISIKPCRRARALLQRGNSKGVITESTSPAGEVQIIIRVVATQFSAVQPVYLANDINVDSSAPRQRVHYTQHPEPPWYTVVVVVRRPYIYCAAHARTLRKGRRRRGGSDDKQQLFVLPRSDLFMSDTCSEFFFLATQLFIRVVFTVVLAPIK